MALIYIVKMNKFTWWEWMHLCLTAHRQSEHIPVLYDINYSRMSQIENNLKWKNVTVLILPPLISFIFHCLLWKEGTLELCQHWICQHIAELNIPGEVEGQTTSGVRGPEAHTSSAWWNVRSGIKMLVFIVISRQNPLFL